jgi:DNA-3-methyladenine glycosylase
MGRGGELGASNRGGAADGPPRPVGCPLTPGFFVRSACDVAPDLIGKILWREGVGGGRLVEVEAYLPEGDPACHAHRGPTRRNAAMFGPPGSLYVFLSYGIHMLLNLVCEEEGVGSAVLLRAFDPIGDIAPLERRRVRESRDSTRDTNRLTRSRIAKGPGNLGRALGIDLSWNGRLVGSHSGLFLLDDGVSPEVVAVPRVGISRGREFLLRYLDPAGESLSGLSGNSRKSNGKD